MTQEHNSKKKSGFQSSMEGDQTWPPKTVRVRQVSQEEMDRKNIEDRISGTMMESQAISQGLGDLPI
jgi:hypothetical protein